MMPVRRANTQMYDECDDTRSLEFPMEIFDHRVAGNDVYPPQYLSWLKPPSSYFPPRGEAPPPYEEAIATPSTSTNPNLNVAVPLNSTSPQCTSSNNFQTTTFTVLTNDNINRPQSLTSGSITTTTTCATTGTNSNSTRLDLRVTDEDISGARSALKTLTSSQIDNGCAADTPLVATGLAGETESGTNTNTNVSTTASEEPIAGPSVRRVLAIPEQSKTSQLHGVHINASELFTPPPAYEDTRFFLQQGKNFFRHSLTLPRRPEYGFANDSQSYYFGNQQRHSLQLNVGDWSSCSSTLSLSTPDSPGHIIQDLDPEYSSSSSSSLSNVNP